MLSMALERWVGRAGWKVVLFCFSQPRGNVVTNSSNRYWDPVEVVTLTWWFVPETRGFASILITGSFRWISARLRAAAATESTIFLYVDATKRLAGRRSQLERFGRI